MSQTQIETEVKELTFSGVKVSQEMYQLIMKGKSAVSTAADIIAEICEQGRKENLGVMAIRKIVKGIFKDSLSERRIRQLLPKNCKNQNMIRDQRKDRVKLFVDIESVKVQEHRQRIYEDNLRYEESQLQPEPEIAAMATREMSANSVVIEQPEPDHKLELEIVDAIENETNLANHLPSEIEEQWEAIRLAKEEKERKERELEWEAQRKRQERIEKNYKVISELLYREGCEGEICLPTIYTNDTVSNVLVDEIVRLRERIAELEGRVPI
jgi:hypothetical protein